MTIDIVHGIGYRVGESNRNIGSTSGASSGFVVINQQNNQIFVTGSGGIWGSGGIGTFGTSGTFGTAGTSGIFSQEDFDEWILS
jgi:hypothetical protein